MGGRTPPPPGVHARTVAKRRPRRTFLIVCEGKKTEPEYFKGFKLSSAAVRIVGAGMNTTGLVDEAIRLKQCDDARDHYWCVFDRDSFPAQGFNEAIRRAELAGFRVAYSNACFEIWYLLHFDYHDAAMDRGLYFPKLAEKLGRKYKKNDAAMYDLLKDRQPQAIRNARRLLDTYSPRRPEQDNPSTTVHELVEELNGQLDASP